MMWVLLVALATQSPDGQWRSEVTATGYPTLAMCREARAGEIKADVATADRQWLVGTCQKSPGTALMCPVCGIGTYSEGCYYPTKPVKCNPDGKGIAP
jgi:hypothetical protein